MKLFLYTIIGLVLCGTFARAQQLPQLNEYMFDKAFINPAYTGTIPYINASAGYRSKFMGMDGAPVSQYFTAYAPLQKKYIGLGIKAVNDKIGVTQNTGITGMFSYYLGLGKGRLSLGLEAGILNQTINFSNLIRKDQVDNAITNDVQSKVVPDAAFGIYYQSKSLFAGWSSYQLLGSKINFTGYSRSPVNRLFNHNYIILGYNHALSEKIRVEPSLLFKRVKGAPIQYDFNLKIQLMQLINIGCSYRTKDAIVPMMELLIKDMIKLGISYDKTLSPLSSYTNGGFEVMLTYRKKLLPPTREKELHPRYYIY